MVILLEMLRLTFVLVPGTSMWTSLRLWPVSSTLPSNT